jgi:2-haloacid dehalogenase
VVKAVFFDVFGTIVDWRKGLGEGFHRAFARHGTQVTCGRLADLWMAELREACASRPDVPDAFRPFREIVEETLERTLRGHAGDVPIPDKEKAVLQHALERLPAWPDSIPGLRSLRREYVVAACCDASIASTTWLAKNAGLPFDLVLGADIAGARLPDPRLYTASAAALGLAPGEVMVASCHNGDLEIARSAGFKTGFFARPKETGGQAKADLAPSEAWDVVAFDLLDLARHLESAIF